MSDINQIEDSLKADASKVSEIDLFKYLYIQTKDENINPETKTIDNIKEYLKRICNSFSFENIFVNTSHYGQIVALIIGLLIPFYYFFPRFYKMGVIGLIIGLSSFMGLVGKTNELYSSFFQIFILYLLLFLLFFILYFLYF